MTDTLITSGDTPNTTAETQQTADTQTTDSTATSPTTEGQDQQTQAQSTDDQGNADDKSGAPEKYELTASEGRDFDPAVMEAYSEVARELNLSNGDAQKLLDKVAPVMHARQQEQLATIKSDWEHASKVDKEFGGDKLNENLGIAQKALDAFGTPALKSLLVETGLGNNPEVIRFMLRAGKTISEDKVHNGRASPNGDKSHADRLYAH
jgi:hypothetical protein